MKKRLLINCILFLFMIVLLTVPSYAQTTTRYEYDILGNRIGVDGVAIDYYSGTNRLKEDSQFIYVYDATGKLSTKTDKATNDIYRYQYNVEDLLVEVAVKEEGVGDWIIQKGYVYDHEGNLVKEVDPSGEPTYYMYDLQGNLLYHTAICTFNISRQVYHVDEVAGLGFDSDTSDYACCGTGSHCVYEGSCYAPGEYFDLDGDGLKEARCYPTGNNWISTDYNEGYCTAAGYLWNLSTGDANTDSSYNPSYAGDNYIWPEGCRDHPGSASVDCCCGDDEDENFGYQAFANNSYNGCDGNDCTGLTSDTNLESCCAVSGSCLKPDGSCSTPWEQYSFGESAGVLKCDNNNRWRDPDFWSSSNPDGGCDDESYNGVVGPWTTAGESGVGEYDDLTTEECCGDDLGEGYYCNPDDGSDCACCASPGYVSGGKCYYNISRIILHSDESAGLGFSSDPSDFAGCVGANSCVYEGVCYNASSYADLDGDGFTEAWCYHEQNAWISTDYHEGYCTNAGYLWNLSTGDADTDSSYNPSYAGDNYIWPEGCRDHPGSASVDCCCGDDEGEIVLTQFFIDPLRGCEGNDCTGLTSDTNLESCCSDSTSCVAADGACVPVGEIYDFGPEYGILVCEVEVSFDKGYWYDPDFWSSSNPDGGCDDESYNGVVGPWTTAGESGVGEYDNLTTEECCGDDLGEGYYCNPDDGSDCACCASPSYVSGGKCYYNISRIILHSDESAGLGFSSDLSDFAGCVGANSCVYEGVCYDASSYADLDGDGFTEAWCYHEQNAWISTDYNEGYCTNAGYDWNLTTGDANIDPAYNPGYGDLYWPDSCRDRPGRPSTYCCCGDDEDENFGYQAFANNSYNGCVENDCTGLTSDTNLESCCAVSGSCLKPDGSCSTPWEQYSFGESAGVLKCDNNNRWRDPDFWSSSNPDGGCDDESYNGVVGPWTTAGDSGVGEYDDLTTEECCGDDLGEGYYCNGLDSSDCACCSGPSYVKDGECIRYDDAGREFKIKQDDEPIAAINKQGMMAIKGTLLDTASTPEGFIIRDSNGDPVSWIELDGDMYLSGELFLEQSNLAPTSQKDIIVKNSTGSVVGLFDDLGNLYLRFGLIHSSTFVDCDVDGDGYLSTSYECAGTDCDDSDPSIWQLLSGYVDSDGDGEGAGSSTQVCSNNSLPSGYSDSNTDCDDNDVNVWRIVTGYPDTDIDGYGGTGTELCIGDNLPTPYIEIGGDCFDSNASVNPGQTYFFTHPYDGFNYDYNCNGDIDGRVWLENGTSGPAYGDIYEGKSICDSDILLSAGSSACGYVYDKNSQWYMYNASTGICDTSFSLFNGTPAVACN